jgi:AcrR family transcriptional regulator
MAGENAEPIDERVRRSKETVLATTFKLMWEEGIGGVSIDEVARRSGVAKTTIYRHWPSRSALLIDACSRLATKPEAPDTGSLKGDLTALLSRLAQQLKAARWPAILPSIIDAAERDQEIARLHQQLQATFSAPYRTVIERARQKGDLPKTAEVSELLAGLLGPMFYRRWFSRAPIDDKFVQAIVARALGAAKR